jgi:hypothetical protein
MDAWLRDADLGLSWTTSRASRLGPTTPADAAASGMRTVRERPVSPTGGTDGETCYASVLSRK